MSIICNVTPCSSQAEETHNTLKFANRAKMVRIVVTRNEVVDTKSLIKKYEAEIAQLKSQLESRDGAVKSSSPNKGAARKPSTNNDAVCNAHARAARPMKWSIEYIYTCQEGSRPIGPAAGGGNQQQNITPLLQRAGLLLFYLGHPTMLQAGALWPRKPRRAFTQLTT